MIEYDNINIGLVDEVVGKTMNVLAVIEGIWSCFLQFADYRDILPRRENVNLVVVFLDSFF